MLFRSEMMRRRARKEAEAAADKCAKPQRDIERLLDRVRREGGSFLNAVDTPAALKALEQLVRAANTFVGEVPDATRGGTTRWTSSWTTRSRSTTPLWHACQE